MEEQILKILIDYGIAGVVIFGLGYVFWKQEQDRREREKFFMEQFIKAYTQFNTMTEQAIKAIERNTVYLDIMHTTREERHALREKEDTHDNV